MRFNNNWYFSGVLKVSQRFSGFLKVYQGLSISLRVSQGFSIKTISLNGSQILGARVS